MMKGSAYFQQRYGWKPLSRHEIKAKVTLMMVLPFVSTIRPSPMNAVAAAVQPYRHSRL
jgi:hypothetical protein